MSSHIALPYGSLYFYNVDSSPLLRRWLNLCLCLVFAMVVLGGLTRLTESGLSIVRWKLVSGVLPPLGEAGWQGEFAEYRSSPQYREVNRGMDIAEFRRIFWLEYLHRLLGRLVGLTIIVPTLVLAFRRFARAACRFPQHFSIGEAVGVHSPGRKRQLAQQNPPRSPHFPSPSPQPFPPVREREPSPLLLLRSQKGVGARAPGARDSEPINTAWLLPRMGLASLLVVAQGAAGWLMVKSGLVDQPWVSPYRLALHLLLAVALFGWLLVTRLRLAAGDVAPVPPSLRRHAWLAVAALLLQITLGAFVAGLRAGLTYNSFPWMDGDFVPRGFWLLSPAWRNVTENIPAVQFLHRWWAFAVAALVLTLAWRVRRYAGLRRLALGAAFLVCAQVALGIATLLLAVPVALGTLHQATAILLFGWLLALAYAMSQATQTALPRAQGSIG